MNDDNAERARASSALRDERNAARLANEEQQKNRNPESTNDTPDPRAAVRYEAAHRQVKSSATSTADAYQAGAGPTLVAGAGALADHDYAGAKSAYLYALSRGDKSPLVYNNLALSYQMSGDFSQAEHNYENALRTDATYKLARRNLYLLYASEAGKQADSKHFEQADLYYLKMLPLAEKVEETMIAWQNIGVVRARAGNVKGARQAYEQAARRGSLPARQWLQFNQP